MRYFEALESRQLLTADGLVISEFMASNKTALSDAEGEFPDWVEIWNSSPEPILLDGYYLTDNLNNLTKWAFPPISLAAGEYLVVFASGKDATLAGQHHTSFKLDADGETLALVGPSRKVVDQYGTHESSFPQQKEDISFGLLAVGDGSVHFLAEPTPGEANTAEAIYFVADTKFSVDRGFYDQPFDVVISSATSGATIAYTTDGSLPSPHHGVQVVNTSATTVPISTTTTLRAMAYKEGMTSTNVDTQTYVFAGDVIRQTGDDLPNTWGHAGADYDMDPDIVDDPRYSRVILDSLTAIPTLSLVTEIDHWFATGGQGIYVRGKSSERPVSVEWIDPSGNTEFQIDGAVEIQGGSSTNRWKSDKLSLQLKFKQRYGPTKLNFPLFGADRAESFDTLVLDARLNQAWAYGGGVEPTDQRRRAQYTRDQFASDLQQALGGLATAGTHVHLYLNGIYWGLYNLHERPDEHFAASYLGGDSDDYDVIKHNTEIVNGSLDNYRRLLRHANRDLRQPANYRAVTEILELDAFIDYMLVNYYVGNSDWAHHNWYATFNQVSADGKWRFHSWDAEHILKSVNQDSTGRDDQHGPTHLHQRLTANADYRQRFADRVYQVFFNNGALTPEKAASLYQARADAVYEAVVAESARWGDNQRSRPYTRDFEWMNERDRLLEEYFPRRTKIVLQQLQHRGWYPNFGPPEILDGPQPDTFALQADRGTIYFTLDGSDPSDSQTSRVYSQPISLAPNQTLKTRVQLGRNWSALQIHVPNVDHRTGDFNQDGHIDVSDLDLMYAALNSTAVEYDLNDDNRVDQADVLAWIRQLALTEPGDINLDRRVDFEDFTVLASNFGRATENWSDGDFNADGFVDFEDFVLLAAHFGFGRSKQ